jgi:SAM-dependent methyltransferase
MILQMLKGLLIHSMHYENKKDCRLCSSNNLSNAFSLKSTPLANEFVKDCNKSQDEYPLEINICEDCGHVQLGHVVNSDLLFTNYLYASGTSDVFVHHFNVYAEYTKDILNSSKEAPIAVDIGSNDGTLLNEFKKIGFDVLGVEPAKNLAEISQNNSIDVINGYFNQEVMESIVASKGKIDVITANNVFAHIDDLQSVVKNVCSLLSDEGLLVFEVSYLGSVLDGLLFDTIYHEHLDYHSVLPLIGFLKENGFKVIDILLVESHGGSIRVTSSKQQSSHKPRESVRKFVVQEQKHPITKETLNSFYSRIQQEKNKITNYLKSLKHEGKKIVAYGAPAKLTTLFYEFDINSELVDFVIDDSPLKQGLYTPGSHISILAADSVDFNGIDVIFIAAWNFAPSIIEKIKERLRREAIFIAPLPDFKVIANDGK